MFRDLIASSEGLIIHNCIVGVKALNPKAHRGAHPAVIGSLAKCGDTGQIFTFRATCLTCDRVIFPEGPKGSVLGLHQCTKHAATGEKIEPQN